MTAPRLARHLAEHRAVAVGRLSLGCDAPHGGGAVVHDHGSVGVLLAGSMTLWMGAVFTLRPGDVFLIPEGAPHYSVERAQAEIYGISLCPSCLTEPWGRVFAQAFEGARRGVGALRHLGPESMAKVEGWMGDLEAELEAEGPGHDLAVSGLLSLLAVAIQRASPIVQARSGAQETPLVGDALTYIEAHALEGISLREVARSVGRAPAHLAAVMKSETGRTVVEWITHVRMTHGRQLLLRSDESIEGVAERLGFASPSHFHRTFRKVHGATPSAWRRMHRGG